MPVLTLHTEVALNMELVLDTLSLVLRGSLSPSHLLNSRSLLHSLLLLSSLIPLSSFSLLFLVLFFIPLSCSFRISVLCRYAALTLLFVDPAVNPLGMGIRTLTLSQYQAQVDQRDRKQGSYKLENAVSNGPTGTRQRRIDGSIRRTSNTYRLPVLEAFWSTNHLPFPQAFSSSEVSASA